MFGEGLSTVSEKKKNAIVESASKLFLDKGYGAVSMDEVASHAKVSKRTVYNHFNSKEFLFAEVVRMAWDSVKLPSLDFKTGDDVREILEDFTYDFLSVMRSEKLTNLLRLVMGEAEKFPEIKNLYSQNGIRTVLSTVEGFFTAVDNEGILKIDDSSLAAQQYVGMIKESLFWPVMVGVFDQPSKEREEQVIESAMDIIFKVYSI